MFFHDVFFRERLDPKTSVPTKWKGGFWKKIPTSCTVGPYFCSRKRRQVKLADMLWRSKKLWYFRKESYLAKGFYLQKRRAKSPYLENQLLLISINFTPKTSHSCLKKWYTRLSRYQKKSPTFSSTVKQFGGRRKLVLMKPGVSPLKPLEVLGNSTIF